MSIEWHEARHYARKAGSPLPEVDVPLGEAVGCVLAKPLVALSPLPAYDAAAMDGYAVAGPGPWRLVGRILAGDPGPPPPLSPGYATEIGTGAVVPAGADAVLPYERATRNSRTVTGEFSPGRHIRRRGEDCPAGRRVLDTGTLVSPVVLGLAAGLGHDTLTVHRRPRVATVVTGAELRRGGIPAAGQVRDAIGPMLPGMIRAAGAEPVGETMVTDDAALLVEALLRPDADVLVVCGATSAGAADHLRSALDTLGARVPIHGVACRPGHPQLFAVLPDGRFVVGLPGNPYAALVAALTLVTPLLGRLSGRPEPPVTTAALAGPVTPHDRDTRLVPVTVAGSAALPVGHDRPGSLWGAAMADALAVVPAGWPGDEVELLALPSGSPPAVTVVAGRDGRRIDQAAGVPAPS
ncbi:molybdopterin molybdenumtransferase MoeA [Actinoplanes italicus]|uniref:Molybdopterin molybdenumtransferase n=1 Tax=Actinoplanes italicus TaxID=113567 RepID=A0A2T0JYN2_9ACTN|nr:molybdopterin molybdotransferase MoeA [Actinoplanes italicus]PRX14638.1 molybdopterin molybdotransferase [Actinoplanes italicus]GIE34501.1 molybdopterin molybdenumtransferase MoeA [Actinoplanes italicus]